MNFRRWLRVPESVGSALSVFVVAVMLLVTTVSAQAQGTYTAPTTAVGTTSATQTVTVTITTAGTLASIYVTSQGSTTLDYSYVTGGTCAALTMYTAGQTCTVSFNFTPKSPWTRYGSVTLMDGTGKLLGNSFLIGTGTGPLASYPLSSSTPTALGATFTTPRGIATDSRGDVFVADANTNTVTELLAVAGFLPAIPATVTFSGFSSPSGVAVDGAGNVFVADTGNNAVKELLAVGGSVPATPTIVSVGSGYSSPTGVAVDGSGNVYVADSNNNAIKEVVAVNGVIMASTTPVTLANSFSFPTGVAVDTSGNVYVADSNNGAVKKIAAVGGVIPSNPTVTTILSGLTLAYAVTLDPSGDLYVADATANTVKEIVASGGFVSSSSSVVPLGGGFSGPHGVATDSNGDLYVADSNTGFAKELSAQSPATLTFASTPVGTTSTDSPKSVTLANIGNATLVFPVPSTGTNPSISANFSVGSSSTCPRLTSASTSAGSLAAGATCTDVVSFLPIQSGTISGSLVSTDNSLNATGTTQSVPLSGSATLGTLTINSTSPSTAVNSTSVTLSASVTYGGVAPTGAVTFSVNSGTPITAICTGSSSPLTCTATYNPSSLTVASYSISASIAADSNYNSANGSGMLTITQGTPGIVLSTSGTPSTTNASVTLTATVTPSSGIVPNGKVSFTTTLNGSTTAINGCTSLSLTTLKATCTTNALAVGVNSISATISADTNFVAATATSINQTVNTASTTLTLSPTTAATVDTPITFTATLAAASGFSPTTAGGNVAFSANGTAIVGCTASSVNASHQATCTTSALTVPADTISAVYSGDPNFGGSQATSVTQTMTKNTPVISVTSSLPTTAVVNQSVTFTATVTPNGASASGVVPTGSITFTKGGTTLCSAPVVVTGNPANGTATASCSTPFTGIFSATSISAAYSGDTNFNAGTAGSVLQTVLAAPTTTAVTSNLPTVGINQNVTLSATVTPANTGTGYTGTATPQTGTVTFSDSAVTGTFCSTPVSGGVVQSTCTHSFTSLGNHIVTAAFTSTDSNFSSSTTSVTSVTISVGTGSVGLTLSPAVGPTGLSVNQSASFTAAFTNFPTGLTASPGTVTYFDGSNAISGANCSNVAVPVSGTLPACSYSFPTAGQHTISAAFTPGSGGGSFTALTSNSVPVSIGQTGASVAFTAPTVATSTTDQPVTFTATVTPAVTGTNPSGLIAFTYVVNAGTPVALCPAVTVSTTSNVTSASCTAPLPAPGTYTVTATYSGDTNFPTNKTTLTQVVGKTATAIVLTLAANPQINSPATYSATVSVPGINDSGLTLPTGTITITDTTNPSVTCTATVSPSTGQASCTLTAISAGSAPHTITATYSGDTNFSTSTTSLPQTIAIATPMITLASSRPISTATQTVSFIATITFSNLQPGVDTPSSPLPVTFNLPPGYSCAPTESVAGFVYTETCTVTFSAATPGFTANVSATYAGDTKYGYGAATAQTTQTLQNFTIAASPTTITIAQGNSNTNDPYTSQTIAVAVTPGAGGFADTSSLVLTCTITPLTSPPPNSTAPSCTPGTFANGAFPITIATAASVPTGTYSVVYKISDTNSAVPSLSQTATVGLTVINTAATDYVGSIGTTLATFTAPTGLTLSCGTQVSLYQAATKTYTVIGTLASIGVTCSKITEMMATPGTYTFTITAGTQNAMLEHRSSGIVLAYAGVPLLLLLGLLPASKKIRKASLRGLAILSVGLFLMHATGCSSGGFPRPQGTRATDGQYLLNIVNASNATVAEIPFVISN